MFFKEFNPNEDDCHKVAKLVYSVDQKTYFKLFGSQDKAIFAIETLLSSGKDDFVPNGSIFTNNNIVLKNDNQDNNEFYIILDEDYDIKNSENTNENGKNIIGLVQMVKGKHSGLFGDILYVFKKLKISDALRFSFIYFLDYFTLAKTNSNDLYVAELAIDENQRGKGLGTCVLKKIIEKAGEKNFKRVVLDADFNNNGAFRLYESLEFKVFNKRKIKLINSEKGMNNMEYIL
ncbi:hypothetical protein ALNOE001_14470 [Candidatus Methanobinarius endosymbioticus]|uniref:N-acetyltransferase domain-containing protein n=1 Tax=Candidatus Methanobinarius endosymbioticus TaxID=2006182 RepID=A0A366M9J9_9EURY|nr:hypothetical protein ALNOE001_14470 [Candidatus Methanobinarius endosymbioticus]